MSPKFVVSHLDQQIGPFTEQELKSKWVKGELLPIDYVYDEAKSDWILLAERFEWALSKEGAPPPLRPEAQKRKMPPAPTPAQSAPQAPMQHAAMAPLEITSQTLLKEWKKPGAQGAKVKIVDGMGEIDLSPVSAGQVELVLQDSSAGTLKLQEPLRIQVRPQEPEEITWGVAAQHVVGNDLEIWVKAVDGKGNLCAQFADDFKIKIQGPEPREVIVRMTAGQTSVKVSNTKAETWTLTFHYEGKRNLRLPMEKSLEWQPGPAARLILDGPPELVAGNPLKVQVKAVDQFGNLAKTFQGTVILEVKAS